jgi:hypothetical protein
MLSHQEGVASGAACATAVAPMRRRLRRGFYNDNRCPMTSLEALGKGTPQDVVSARRGETERSSATVCWDISVWAAGLVERPWMSTVIVTRIRAVRKCRISSSFLSFRPSALRPDKTATAAAGISFHISFSPRYYFPLRRRTTGSVITPGSAVRR